MIGDWLSAALWYSTPDEKEKAEKVIAAALDDTDAQIGPIEWHDFSVEEAPCPEPPEHFPRETRLLVGECEVVGEKKKGSFVANLSESDLMELRKLTRRTVQMTSGETPTDAQCDAILEDLGPEAAVKTIH